MAQEIIANVSVLRMLFAVSVALGFSSDVEAQLGIRGMLAAPNSTLRVGDRTVGEFDELHLTIERYQGDWAWVRGTSGQEGWLPRRDVVPLDHAVGYFTQKIAANPGVSGWYFRRGAAQEALEQYDLAMADISVAIALDPGIANYLNTRANIYDTKGDHERALVDYNAALRLEPGKWIYWFNAGLTRHSLKQYDKAIQNFSRAMQLSPSIPAIYLGRAQSWKAMGDYERALSDYARTIELDLKNVEAYNGRATIWATCPVDRYRDGKRALAAALRACEVSAWAKAAYVSTLAQSYAETGDFENAVRYADQAIKLAKEEKWTDLSVLEQELDLFKAGKPYRTAAVASE